MKLHRVVTPGIDVLLHESSIQLSFEEWGHAGVKTWRHFNQRFTFLSPRYSNLRKRRPYLKIRGKRSLSQAVTNDNCWSDKA